MECDSNILDKALLAPGPPRSSRRCLQTDRGGGVDMRRGAGLVIAAAVIAAGTATAARVGAAGKPGVAAPSTYTLRLTQDWPTFDVSQDAQRATSRSVVSPGYNR